MRKLILAIPLSLLAACSSVPGVSGVADGISSGLDTVADALDISPYLNPYRVDVRQGNMVTQEMAAQLKPGLTKDQVRFLLGTPLLTDIFHADRWDYVYRFKSGKGDDVQIRRLAVHFADGKLARVSGDVAEQAAAAGEQPPKPAARVIEIKGPEKPAAEDKEPPPTAAQ